MDAEAIKSIGIGVLSLGVVMLLLSGFGALSFPTSSAPANADLATLLTLLWQRAVITISMLIVGIVGTITGTILYGFGRTIEEISFLQPTEEEPKKRE